MKEARLELKVPPLLLVVLAGALMWLVARSMPEFRLALPGLVPTAVLVAAAGAAIVGWSVVSFGQAGTTVNPMKPEASSSLVTTGMYAYSRNPMYLGFLLILLGWAMYLAHAAAMLFPFLFLFYMNRFQIAPEERALASRFGNDFTRYTSRVRRWL